MKIHFNGITIHFTLYNVFELIGNHLSMVESMNLKLKNKYYVIGKNATTIKINISTPKRVNRLYGEKYK